jgi:hypothetical protein
LVLLVVLEASFSHDRRRLIGEQDLVAQVGRAISARRPEAFAFFVRYTGVRFFAPCETGGYNHLFMVAVRN